MTRAYVVFNDSNNLYFPVKAALNPYTGEEAYCGGLPQFFGGKVDAQETNPDAVRREVAEESHLTYLLTAKSLLQVMQSTMAIDEKEEKFEDWYFYLTDKWRKPTEHKWPETLQTWRMCPAKFREMCFVASAPIGKLLGALGLKEGDELDTAPWLLEKLPKLADALVEAALGTAPSWAKSMLETQPTKDFLQSETLDGFACAVCTFL
ncbi:MAG TPA: NUDIX domain-containing protein [Rhizomicrobium sp.]|nr:NUDIX domain-containing protein [Rhizomicrobium sp.]